jgi:uncharacterized OB-fold protein
MTGMQPQPFRLLPQLDELNRPYWTGGERGELVMQACPQGCILHPPVAYCTCCGSKEIAPRVLSGRGTVHSFTVNHHPWNPTMPERYVIALVVIEEQDDVRIMTNIIGCEPDEVHIGMPVQVTFENHEDVWLPLFEPATGGQS